MTRQLKKAKANQRAGCGKCRSRHVVVRVRKHVAILNVSLPAILDTPRIILLGGRNMSAGKKPPIMRIKTVSSPDLYSKSNELLAGGFVNDAEAYIGAAMQLEDFESFGPRYFLFCHALELLLKAQILASGGDQGELFDIRHDLEKAYSRAVELGYTPADDRVKQIVVWLAPYHKHHTFRYKETGYLIVPKADDLLTIFQSMHLEIEATVRVAYFKAEASQPR